MDDSFVKAPVAVPKLSGFDKSHQNLLTSKVGTITPIMVDELIPGSRVNLKLALSAALPPLASDTYMRCSIKTEAFFVPMRLLCGSFESWFTDDAKDTVDAISSTGGVTTTSFKGQLPIIRDTSVGSQIPTWVNAFMTPGSLPDYLGFRSVNGEFLRSNPVSALPFLAYHKIWNDWYRNSLVQKECFLPDTGGAGLTGACVAPYVFLNQNNNIWFQIPDFTLADGKSIFSLRQRNFGLDYFTTATPDPQQGSAQVVTFDTSGSEGQFSIAALRAANSMQQFKERNNLLGNLYVEQLYGRYGVRPSDGIAQRSLYLGRGEFEVYSKGIYQTSTPPGNLTDGQPVTFPNTTNPFGSVGARYGSAYASGEHFLVNFEATEPGYLFVMATLVPRVTYSTGTDRMLTHYCKPGSLVEMANPILQNMGPQPIYDYELSPARAENIFGYTDRYAEFKTKQDSLHGLFRDGQALAAFALQRSFAVGQEINSAFLEIPTDYMDQVTAVNAWISEYGYMLDSYFEYHVAMPLSKYSLPTLQDPAYEHGKTVVVSRGGNKL